MALAPRDMLPEVIAGVEAAGAMIAAEFCRRGGPRFTDHVTAPVDHEAELLLRERLMRLLPARFIGEEAGVLDAPANGFCWVVDPHDGTRAFLEGRRGSAVSVALLREGTPVLGVVFAPLSPDRGPDLIAWADGTPMTRNGAPVANDLRDRKPAAGDVVFLNHGAWQRPVWHGTAVAPGRFLPLPSIAYRLARVAVGDGIATLTLRPVNALDIAAGHSLLMAAGGVLVTEDGTPVTYSALGESRPAACFGGAPAAVATLRSRTWRGSTEERRPPRISLGWPRAPEGTALDRAIGAMLGLMIGDSSAAADGRVPGQPGPRGEAALGVARAVAAGTRRPRGGGLLRAVPLAVPAASPAEAAEAAKTDAVIAGADPTAAGALAAAVAAGLGGAGREEVLRLAGSAGKDPALAAALRGAALGRRAFSPAEALPVLTCRPAPGPGVAYPRPEEYWPDDLIDLAEALLLLRRARQETP